MKKILFLGLALMGVVSVTSCSSDDEVSNDNQQAQAKAIGFSAITNMAGESRATPTTSTNATTQVTNFKVWAYNSSSTNSYYMGTAGDGGIIINREGTTDTWDYNTSTDVHYWPGFPMNFYALTPATNSNYSYNDSILTYTVPTANSEQIDPMVASTTNQTVESNNGTVQLTFQHFLSQVAFRARTRTSDMTVEIDSIILHNVRNTYSFNLQDGPNGGGNAVSGDYYSYAIGLATPVTVSSTTAVDVTDADGALILAPQNLTAWAEGTPTTSADENHQSYIEIKCKIKEGDAYLVGSSSSYGSTYVPFSATWQRSYRYVYTLSFGVGKTSDGGSSTTPISFSVSVDNWNDATASDIAL